MKTKSVSCRLDEVEFAELEKQCAGDRASFIREAILEKLHPVKTAELTDTEKRNLVKGAKNISDLMSDLIMQEASNRKNFLSKMADEDFAKLVAGRLPKENVEESDLEEEVLSLQDCLRRLPDMEDITAELNKVKGKLFKAESERDLNLKLLKHSRGYVQERELMEFCYRKACEYVIQFVVRGRLPGFGDGGGLTEKAYSEITSAVERELANLKVCK